MSTRKLHIKWSMTFITRSATNKKYIFSLRNLLSWLTTSGPNPFQSRSLESLSIVLPACWTFSNQREQLPLNEMNSLRTCATCALKFAKIRSSCNEQKKSSLVFSKKKMFSLSFRSLNSILKEEKKSYRQNSLFFREETEK